MPPPIHRTIRLAPLDGADERSVHLSLLGAFELRNGSAAVAVSGGSQRLLAFVALQGRPVSRDVVAEALWPGVSETAFHASLRSAIWRLEQLARDAMSIDVLELEIASNVEVDLEDAEALAHRILIVDTMPDEGDMTPAAIAALASDLLPDWYDEWTILEVEAWRQLRLHALEVLAQKLLEADRFAEAIAAASEARQADPLRESPHALLIRIHLAEGNQSEAIKEFTAYRRLLKDELGIEPTPQLWDLVRPLRP